VAGVIAITKIRRIVIFDWTSWSRHALLDAGGANSSGRYRRDNSLGCSLQPRRIDIPLAAFLCRNERNCAEEITWSAA
jgi:hypothetical protein